MDREARGHPQVSPARRSPARSPFRPIDLSSPTVLTPLLPLLINRPIPSTSSRHQASSRLFLINALSPGRLTGASPSTPLATTSPPPAAAPPPSDASCRPD